MLLTAVTFDFFTTLGQQRLTGREIAKKLELHPRGVADFLDALVAMKFLEREGDGADAKYFNTPATALYLDRASPRYIGGIPEMLNARLFKYWNDLPEALRTGKPQNETKHGGKNIFDELYADPEKLECFLDGMTGLSRINFEALADKFDFSRYRSSLRRRRRNWIALHRSRQKTSANRVHQFRSSAGRACGEKAHRRRRVNRSDPHRDRRFLSGPAAEGRRDHDGNDPARLELGEKDEAHTRGLRRASARRRVIAVEALIDNARRENVFGLLMSLNMLIEFGDAFDYSAADFEKWCREVGFKRFEVIHLAGPSSAAIAYK